MATMYVSGGGDAISTAWASASDGDTLLVADGTYNVPVRPSTPPDVDFVSENGPANCIIQGNGTNDNLCFGTSTSARKCTITGFTIYDVPGSSANTLGGTFKWIREVHRCIYIGAVRANLCYGVDLVTNLLAVISNTGEQTASSRVTLRSSLAFHNCTIVYTGTNSFFRVAGAANGHVYANVLIWCAGSYTVPFVAGSGSATATYRFYNCMAQDLGWINDFEGNLSEGCQVIAESPFRDLAGGDYRPVGVAATLGNPSYLPPGGDLYGNAWAASPAGCLAGGTFRTTDWIPDSTNVLGNGPVVSVKGVEKWWMGFTGVEDGTDVSMEAVPYNGTDPPSVSLEYSRDGRKWLPFYVGHTHVVLRAGGSMFLRAPDGANNASFGSSTTYANDGLLQQRNQFVVDGAIAGSGNLLSIFSSSPTSGTSISAPGLFRACNGLVSSPGLYNDLSSTGYAGVSNCDFMFVLCQNLETIGPTRIRTTSSASFARHMFGACPVTSAASVSILGSNGFAGMFEGCESLVVYPDVSMVTSVENAGMYKMFSGCTSLRSALDLSGVTTVYYYGMNGMFYCCTSLATPPSLSGVTSVGQYGMYQMFWNCTSLPESPVLPDANYNNTQSLNRMFSGCSSLSKITTLMSSWPSGTNSTGYWCSGVSSAGTFYCPSSLGTQSTITRGVNACPANWTVVNI